jgi:hypothetical protein
MEAAFSWKRLLVKAASFSLRCPSTPKILETLRTLVAVDEEAFDGEAYITG